MLLSICFSVSAQDYSKMSSMVRRMAYDCRLAEKKQLLMRQKAASYATESSVRQQSMTAFVRCADTDVLRSEGCRILASWDDIHIATVPLKAIAPLSERREVKRIEAGMPCSVAADTTASIAHVTDVWQQTVAGVPLDGSGVVMGVMDVGFDLTHPTFYSRDMSRYRIRAIWDQLDFSSAGQPYTGTDTIYVGRQYTTESEILAKAYTADADICTHGTHTAGIAAGSGTEDGKTWRYSGMAPEADLCFVANLVSDNISLISADSVNLYTNATDMLGFKYIFDYAASVGKPCVINFSEGSQETFYDTQLYNEVLAKLVGPGRIICAAAGNEAWKQTHFSKPQGVEEAGAFILGSERTAFYFMRSDKPVNMTMSFYYSPDSTLIQRTYDTAPLAAHGDSILTDSIDINGDRYTVMITCYPSCYNAEQWATEVCLTDTIRAINNQAAPVALKVHGADNAIDVFAYIGQFASNSIDPSLKDYDNTHNILFPASAPDIICVGGTGYTTQHTNIFGETMVSNVAEKGNRMSYSSIGPTRSGLTKPDVMAPGQNVVSAYSSRYYEVKHEAADIRWSVREFSHNGRKYLWTSNSGTSMAAPVVAGVVALWLQACPTLSPAQVMEVIANTAVRKHADMEYPNNLYGYGEIDAAAGLKYIERVYTGIQNIYDDNSNINGNINGKAIYDLCGRRLNSMPAKGIFIVGGKKVVR